MTTNQTITIPVPEGCEASFDAETNQITFTKIEPELKFWMPEQNKVYCFIWEDGALSSGTDVQGRPKHHNIFKTREDAEDVSRYQRVFNAVCRAVKQVDPDFVPDWNDQSQSKHTIEWTGEWKKVTNWNTQTIFPPVSTYEKYQQVKALLDAEGIVPVGVKQ